MAKLFRILATASSDVIEPYAIPQNIGLQSRLVSEVTPKTTGTCTLKYNHLDGSNPTIYTAASAATAVQAAMNAANTTDVTVTLLFRRAFIELMDQKGWNTPDIIMAQEFISIGDGD